MIFLPEEIIYLTKLMQKDPNTFWVKDKVLEKFNDQVKEWNLHKTCEHTFRKYNLVEDRCAKCGAIPVGGGLSAELAEETQEQVKAV